VWRIPAGAIDIGSFDRVDDVDEREQRVEGGVDVLRTADRRVSMEDLLEDLYVRDKPLPAGNRELNEMFRRGTVRVLASDEVHRDVRVDEDHPSCSSR